MATDTIAGGGTNLADFIAGLPKCELHLHLEGTLSPDLKLRLAERNGVDIGQRTVAEVEATYEFDSLTSFLMVYYPAMGVLVTADDFADLAYEYLTKAASQGVRYVEMFFDPQAHTGRGVPFSTVIEGYRQGILRAHAEHGISAELIMCFLRDLSAEFAMATLMESLPYRDWIIGVGLDSDERDNPPSKFAAVFARARSEGYQLTMHCDIDQVGSIDNIRSAIHDIGVDRIDHGTNIVEAQDLVDHVRRHGIGLTCCPVSNSFVTHDMKATEIVTLLRDDVKVTVNSDDPAYFKGYMTENFAALADKAQLSPAELVQLSRNAFQIAWLTTRARDGYLAELDAYAAQHGLAVSGVLEGRVALVTGGARGMGRSHALAMARAGADIVLVDLCEHHPAVAYPMATKADLAETKSLVEAEGARCVTHVADVRDLDALEAIVAGTEADWGSVDIAVANAGVSHMAVINQESAEGWATVIDINLTGTFNTFRAVSPGMMKRRWGRLVGVSSMMGRASNPTMSAYSASKWGVIGMVKAAAQDLAHHGVTVNAVAPGNIATDMVLNEHMFHFMRPDLEHPTAEDMAPVMAGLHAQPVPWLQPEEVTRAVMYLVDPGAEHITGTVMDVSAGASARFTA